LTTSAAIVGIVHDVYFAAIGQIIVTVAQAAMWKQEAAS
jgi:hypothetical protein